MFSIEENTRKELAKTSVYIAIVAFAITIASYFLKAFQAKRIGASIICGTVLLIAGYTLLMLGEFAHLQRKKGSGAKGSGAKGSEHYAAAGGSQESGNNEHSKYITDSVWTRLGYAFLAIFFGLIHFYPQLTFHVRYYDKLAAIGAFLRTVTNLRYISLIGVLFLLAYYFLGTIPKFSEKGMVNKLQLVSRAMLVVYYGITVALLG